MKRLNKFTQNGFHPPECLERNFAQLVHELKTSFLLDGESGRRKGPADGPDCLFLPQTLQMVSNVQLIWEKIRIKLHRRYILFTNGKENMQGWLVLEQGGPGFRYCWWGLEQCSQVFKKNQPVLPSFRIGCKDLLKLVDDQESVIVVW